MFCPRRGREQLIEVRGTLHESDGTGVCIAICSEVMITPVFFISYPRLPHSSVNSHFL